MRNTREVPEMVQNAWKRSCHCATTRNNALAVLKRDLGGGYTDGRALDTTLLLFWSKCLQDFFHPPAYPRDLLHNHFSSSLVKYLVRTPRLRKQCVQYLERASVCIWALALGRDVMPGLDRECSIAHLARHLEEEAFLLHVTAPSDLLIPPWRADTPGSGTSPLLRWLERLDIPQEAPALKDLLTWTQQRAHLLASSFTLCSSATTATTALLEHSGFVNMGSWRFPCPFVREDPHLSLPVYRTRHPRLMWTSAPQPWQDAFIKAWLKSPTPSTLLPHPVLGTFSHHIAKNIRALHEGILRAPTRPSHPAVLVQMCLHEADLRALQEEPGSQENHAPFTQENPVWWMRCGALATYGLHLLNTGVLDVDTLYELTQIPLLDDIQQYWEHDLLAATLKEGAGAPPQKRAPRKRV